MLPLLTDPPIHPLVYFAGPYSHDDPVENTHIAMELWHEVWKKGLIIPICPHWSMFQHFLHPLPYKDWLNYDLHIVSRCDALFRMEGESSGADAEVAFARDNKIPIFRVMAELEDWSTYFWKEPRK